MDFKELAATVLALIGIIYTIKGNKFCWIFNIFSSLVFIGVFYQSKLFGQLLLQFVYIGVGVYGYRTWKNDEKFIPRSIDRETLLILTVGAVILGLSAHLLFNNINISDSVISAFSLVTTYLAAKKVKESWYFWIVIDFCSFLLFITQELYLTATLFIIYTGLAFIGLKKWNENYLSTNQS